MYSCVFCNRTFTKLCGGRSHEVRCKNNPNRKQKEPPWNFGKTKVTDSRILKSAEKLSILAQRVENFGKGKTLESENLRKDKISSTMKTNGKSGGYRENAGRSKKFSVYDTQGKRTTLQSTYEYAVFEILCELGIRWSRPKALKYSGKNYFADFHLIDYDIYLDPKNDYKAKLDKEKIESVIKQNNVKLFVVLKEQITLHCISKLVA